jgi:hypothetical protein
MVTSDITFAALRRFLDALGFVEREDRDGCILFEHVSSGTVLPFRPYRPHDKVTVADLISVRRQLDERGLVSGGALEALVRKAIA